MKFNPFRPNSITSPGMFTGRLEEINAIERCLFQTKHGNPQHFLITGERGIGKSSLLYYSTLIADGSITMTNEMKLNFLVISIEANGLTTQGELVQRIARELKNQLASKEKLKVAALKVWDFLTNWEILGVRFHKDEKKFDPDELQDLLVLNLVSLLEQPDEKIDGIILLIDEADSPAEEANLGSFIKIFTERLTKRGCDKVLLGLAGLPSTISKLRASHESSPRLLEMLSLQPLTLAERKQVVQRGLKVASEAGTEMKISNEGVEAIANLSEGYPHFIQQFSYAAFDEDKDGTIDKLDVLNAAYKEHGALMQLGEKYFTEMYHSKISSEGYRDVLGTMAKYGDSWTEKKTICKESGVSESQVTNALAALKDRRIILVDETRRGHYRLPTRSFAAWINAIRSKKPITGQEADLFGSSK